MAGALINEQENVLADVLLALAPKRPKKRGRKPSKPMGSQGGMAKVKVTQPISKRQQIAKLSLDDQFFLVAAVDAMKIKLQRGGKKPTDKEALFELFKKEGVRQGKIRQSVQTMLAPKLSRSRKNLENSGVDDLDEKVKAAAEGLLKGALK